MDSQSFLCHDEVSALGTIADSPFSITWGGLQRSTLAWTGACLEEAWVVITHEDEESPILDITALRADINALHGTGG